MARMSPPMPVAKMDALIVEELADETLVYDLTRHTAHCLNRTAGLVWRRCDGRATVAEVAAELEKEVSLPKGEAVVWLALDRLAAARLLTEPVAVPRVEARRSRREVLRVAGLVGALLVVPVVESIVAPRAADAASGTTQANCENNCGGVNLPCSDEPGTTCRVVDPGVCGCV